MFFRELIENLGLKVENLPGVEAFLDFDLDGPIPASREFPLIWTIEENHWPIFQAMLKLPKSPVSLTGNDCYALRVALNSNSEQMVNALLMLEGIPQVAMAKIRAIDKNWTIFSTRGSELAGGQSEFKHGALPLAQTEMLLKGLRLALLEILAKQNILPSSNTFNDAAHDLISTWFPDIKPEEESKLMTFDMSSSSQAIKNIASQQSQANNTASAILNQFNAGCSSSTTASAHQELERHKVKREL